MEEYCENICALEGNYSLVALATRDDLGRVRLCNIMGGQLDAYSLLPNETVTSLIATNRLEDAPVGDLLIVGTSFTAGSADFEQLEAEKGRIIILQVTGERIKKLKLACALEVEGGVNALGACKGRLIACVNANNCVYKVSLSATGNLSTSPTMSKGSVSLQCVGVTPGQIMGVSMSVHGSHILIGDLLKSVSLYDLPGKRLTLLMNDVSSHWIQTTLMLGKELLMASDTFGNVLVYGEAMDPFISNRKILNVTSGYHLGTSIIRFLSLSNKGILLIGESGQMWHLSFTEEDYSVLKRLEEVLAGRIAPLHATHRRVYGKINGVDSGMFVDGDLLMRFMELTFKEKEDISNILAVTSSFITQLITK